MTQQQPPSKPQQQPNTCIHGKVCVAMNNYLKGVLPVGKCSSLRCLDVMHLGEGCPHYANTCAQSRIDAVVKELERERENAERDYRDAQDQNERQYKKAKNNTLVSAIELLKEGVGKC